MVERIPVMFRSSCLIIEFDMPSIWLGRIESNYLPTFYKYKFCVDFPLENKALRVSEPFTAFYSLANQGCFRASAADGRVSGSRESSFRSNAFACSEHERILGKTWSRLQSWFARII